MNRKMLQIEAFVNEDRNIVLMQEDAGQQTIIEINPSQVDAIIVWLQDLKKEALQEGEEED